MSIEATSEETAAIPLIDEYLGLPDLEEDLHQIWRNGDRELRAGFEGAFLEDPVSLPVRFAALNAYYRLMVAKRDLEDEDVLGGLATEREAFRKKLAFFVGFQPVEGCNDLRTIRWEIINSCAAEDYERAFRLADRLRSFLPGWHVSFAQGRLLFLAVHLPFWDDHSSLSCWDLPIGPPPADGLSRLSRTPGPFLTLSYCFRSAELTAVSDDAKAQLRKAIAELETASDANPSISPECHLMLGRSYATVGQNHEAARCFRRVLTQRDFVSRHFSELALLAEGQLRELSSKLISSLYNRLVTAHQRAEETDEAIKAAKEWIDEFPKAREAYPLIAQLHAERGDLKAAGIWYRKGEERIPELGDDPKVSLILMLAETYPPSPAIMDRTIDAYGSGHSLEVELIKFALARHWPAFERLDEESKRRWAEGILLLSDKSFSPGFAVHAFSGVVERVLRGLIFNPFREEYRRNPGLVGDVSTVTIAAKPFCQFLTGNGEPTLGLMLIVAAKSVNDSQIPFGPFAAWLKAKCPSYFQRIGKLREQAMIDVRNAEDHFKEKRIMDADAATMFESSKEMVSLIYENPRQ